MGKSFVASVFRRAGVPVFDADAEVHRLQAQGGAAVQPIGRAFPGVIRNGEVDRAELRRYVLSNPGGLQELEAIVHPLVRAAMRRFLSRHRRAGAKVVLLEVPLLVETGQHKEVDDVVVVTAPKLIQLLRLRRRGRLTESQIGAVLARQMPDRLRRLQADALVHTGLSKHLSQAQVRKIMSRYR